MRTFMKLILGLAVVLSAAGIASAETIQSDQRAYTVKYKDGTIEHYVVTWLAQMDVEVHEDGGPAKPLEGHFVDDRRCHWTIASHIDRQVAMVNKAGQQFAQSTLFRSYSSNFQNQGSSWVVQNFRSENCNDAAGRRDSDINDSRNNLRTQFPGVIAADLDKLKQDVKTNAEVVSVDF